MLRSNVLEETCLRIIYFCNKHSLKDGICIHGPILKSGFQDNLSLNNHLLSLYAKCQGVEHARRLFDQMPHRDVVSWTCLLSGYVREGNYEEALRFFHLMRVSDERPNEFTFSNVLRSCSGVRDRAQVHACVIKHGFGSNPILCSGLIDLYSKWGSLKEAVGVFDGMVNGDTVSWTSMISSLVNTESWIAALRLFTRMVKNGVFPNEYTFVKLLSACAFLGISYGKLIHAQLVVWGVKLNLVLKTALVNMYAKCRKMDDAMKVMRQTFDQDVQLWTSLISGCTQNSNLHGAIFLFKLMVASNIFPNNYTYAALLNSCSSAQALVLGKQMHKQTIMAGLEDDSFVGNALLVFYTKCSNDAKDATQVFEEISRPNVVSWTALIAGLAKNSHEQDCFLAFLEMRFADLKPNSFTLTSILQACGMKQFPMEAKKIHGIIIKSSADDVMVGNALVEAYADLHLVEYAISLARQMSNRNVITYTILASKLNQIGQYELTLEILDHMHEDDLKIDGFIISSLLSASASLGAKKIGKQLHCYSIVSGFQKHISVSNGLIDFYGKCLCILDAQKAFDEISKPDVFSWNSLIYTFALNGQTSSSLSTLEDMRLAGIRPDSHTLSAVLFACNRGGIVDMGIGYFHSLRELYGITPQFYHYNLLVDLLGKAGRLDEAVSLIKSMPLGDNVGPVYKRLLNACKLQGNVILARERLDPSDLEIYDLHASKYDDSGRSDLGDKM